MTTKKKNNKNLNEKAKTVQDFQQDRVRLNKSARIMAIVMIVVMLMFTFLSAGLFLFK